MTEEKLLAAIKDLDEQLEEWMHRRQVELYLNLTKRDGDYPHLFREGVSVSNQDGQAGDCASSSAERGESHSSDSPRITFAEPDRVYPTQWIGWLLTGFFVFYAYLLGSALYRAWPQIVRMVR